MKFNMFRTGLLFLAPLFLVGCDLYEETWVSENRIQVREERFFEAIPLAEMDAQTVNGLAQYYNRHGDGDIVLSVTYDPASKDLTAMEATSEAAKLTKAFKGHGLDNVKAGVLPNENEPEMVLVSFNSYQAEAPKDCSTMDGFKSSRDIGLGKDYRLGCTVDTVFARQIARPKDLVGQEQTQTEVDGRRISYKVELYRDGVQNEPLEGESASD